MAESRVVVVVADRWERKLTNLDKRLSARDVHQ